MTVYLKIDGAPGRYFACERYRATLSVAACADMYRDAKRAHEPRHPSCRGCAVGAAHAGDKTMRPAQPVFGSRLCSRCHEPGTRLLYDNAICISCANRQLEVIRGRNGKGRFPIHARPLARQALRILRGADEVCYVFERTTGLIESVFRILHREPDLVFFVRPRRPSPVAIQQSIRRAPLTLVAAR